MGFQILSGESTAHWGGEGGGASDVTGVPVKRVEAGGEGRRLRPWEIGMRVDSTDTNVLTRLGLELKRDVDSSLDNQEAMFPRKDTDTLAKPWWPAFFLVAFFFQGLGVSVEPHRKGRLEVSCMGEPREGESGEADDLSSLTFWNWASAEGSIAVAQLAKPRL